MSEEPGKAHKAASLDKWRCPKCSFDNLELLPTCQICEEPRTKSPKKIQSKGQESGKAPGIICPNYSCKHFNPLSNDTCEKCHEQLFPDLGDEDKQPKPDSSKKELAICRSCGFENDPTNDFCVNCEKTFVAKRIRRKTERPRKAATSRRRFGYGSTVPCPKCGQALRVIDYATGEADVCMDCEVDESVPVVKVLCLFCDEKIKPHEEQSHESKCEARLKFFQKEGNTTYDRCTPLQYETMVYMHKKCEKLHYRKQKQLVQRIKKLGYNERDLQNLHHYIMHYAPIIIHMHVNTHFHFFLGDTHYRNQFETSKSSGALSSSSRITWEDRMFDRKHHSATGFQRVKYGTMNFTNDPKGVNACVGYGQSYFLLKSHVRDRCTITDMDSSSSTATLGTFRFIFHLLLKLSDAEIHSAFEGSKGKEMKSNVIGAYKEIQIHGPVEFAKDIERLYISKDQLKLGDAKALLEQVKTFCSKHSLDYELFQRQKPGVVPFSGGLGSVQKVQDRVVGDRKDLTQEDLRPPPPVAPPGVSVFGGGGSLFSGGLFGASALLPAPAYGYSHYAFGAPVPFSAPRRVEKKKEYGVDYI